jgi:hypothetical protein
VAAFESLFFSKGFEGDSLVCGSSFFSSYFFLRMGLTTFVNIFRSERNGLFIGYNNRCGKMFIKLF